MLETKSGLQADHRESYHSNAVFTCKELVQ